MMSYTLPNTFNKDKVFLIHKSELEKRLAPQFYRQDFKDNIAKIKKVKHKRLGEVVKFSTETWNQKDFFNSTFPYIEISEIDTLSGEIQNISQIEIANAPSRAKMVVRENDIIISTTRPNRGAISFIKKQNDFSIASTGFSIIRDIINSEINREYLFAVIRQSIILKQFEQRSSGGNYPAITQEELSNVVIPIPEINKQEKIISIFKTCFEQKKQNEAAAEKLLAGIDNYLLKELGITLPEQTENNLKNRIFTSQLSELSGNRFDPSFHQLYFHQIVEALEKSKFSKSKLGEHILEISYGASFNNFYVNSGVPLLRIKDLKRNEISVEEVVYLPESARTQLGNCFVKTNDFLITRSGTIGLVAIVPKEIDGFAFGSFMIKFNLKDTGKINREYLSYFLNCELIAKLIERNKIGAIQGNITIPIIKSLAVVMPPLSKQKEIAEHITNIRKQAQLLKDKTKEELKKASEEIEKILLT